MPQAPAAPAPRGGGDRAHLVSGHARLSGRGLKPDPEIFRTFCLHFGLNPAQCFFIDDQPANVFGALRAGMRGMVYHGDPSAILPALRAAQGEA